MRSILILVCLYLTCATKVAEIYLGMGTKVGEVTNNSAIVHIRLTAIPEQDSTGLVPGKAGIARIRYSYNPKLRNSIYTDWQPATPETDFSTQFVLPSLRSNRRYYYQVEMKENRKDQPNLSAIGSFRTAPPPNVRDRVRFQVTTGQDLRGVDTYRYMALLKPDFLVSTGDNVYYDNPDGGIARTVPLAYQKYQRMYGSKPIVEYFRNVSGYFEKDDHDYRFNDADPYQKGRWLSKERLVPGLSIVGKTDGDRYFEEKWLSHEEGIQVFKTVFPMSEKTYRTFRWGKGIQIWLLEGRDFRSPNDLPDGPEKTIWGEEQKTWLKKTLLESDADFRLVISPTPIIGPDRPTKRDNHANPRGFWTEGQEFLKWIHDHNLKNLIIICGDRHWQYHSLSYYGTSEFSCGPTCDEHSVKDKPGQIVERASILVQPYYNLCGGFFTGTYYPEKKFKITFHSEAGKLLYFYEFKS